jgi:hypothetical protein
MIAEIVDGPAAVFLAVSNFAGDRNADGFACGLVDFWPVAISTFVQAFLVFFLVKVCYALALKERAL